MNNTSSTQPSPTKPMSRDQILVLLKTALSVGERKYARRTALAWLAFYPGDLEVSLIHAQALIQEENSLSLKQALHILEELCAADPEFLQARMELTQTKILSGLDSVADSIGYEIGLGKQQENHPSGYVKKIPRWALDLHEARKYLSKGNSADENAIKNAEQTIHHVITQDFNNPLIAVTHIKIMSLNNSLSGLGMLSLAEAYYNRWPKCIQFILFLADSYMAIGDSDQAVSLLHKAVSADIIGQVARRQWGENHPYKSLWPQLIEIKNIGINTPQNIPIPAPVASAMGWNQLPESIFISELGKYSDHEQIEEHGISPEFSVQQNEKSRDDIPGLDINNDNKDTIREAWKDFRALTLKIQQPDLVKMDGRFPIYVVFTTKIGLESKYGNENANVILEELRSLVKGIRGSRISHRKWGSILFCPDDADNVSSFGLKPVPHNDPWGLKLSLSDLDDYLGRRGEMIGAVLIIGGPEVVPFHHLPNPVDDDDPDVPSDNPYATRDENYFVQEWPIGRLPGSAENDSNILLGSIQAIKEHYIEEKRSNPWYRRIWKNFIDAIWPSYRKIQPNLGYSAAVWQRASISVYRTIGQPRSLLISPPVKSCDPFQSNGKEKDALGISTCISLNPSMLAYFNLHGLQDSAEWYGQSDPVEISDYPDFPIALRPQDITNGGRAPKVVFSEACYGAHVTGKRLEEAIALKFLASGSQCVIGSSCISYGSIRAPLIGADLLGHAFWKYLTDGMTVGDALRGAKIHLIKEMNKRQGFLDGEDQKTLISFVLYGDPLSQPYEGDRTSKLLTRSTNPQGSIKTVCARIDNTTEPSPVPEEIMTNVKHVVSHYLPGMNDANVRIGKERTGCQNACRNCLSGNLCPTAQLTPKKVGGQYSDRRVITLSKSIQKGKKDHKQFAHITLGPKGKVIKLAVSR